MIRVYTIHQTAEKQTCVVLSSTEAEFVALVKSCQEVQWIDRILSNCDMNVAKPIRIHEYNRSCMKQLDWNTVRLTTDQSTSERSTISSAKCAKRARSWILNFFQLWSRELHSVRSTPTYHETNVKPKVHRTTWIFSQYFTQFVHLSTLFVSMNFTFF